MWTGKHLLAAGILGDCLRTFADCVLGKLAGQQEADCRLNLAGRDRRTFVVVRKTAGLGGDAFEDVVHERIHDRHGLGRDTGVGMDLLQHLVDVDRVRLLPPALLFLVRFRDVLLRLPGFLGCFTACLGRHLGRCE
jgi:hypothetical protein